MSPDITISCVGTVSTFDHKDRMGSVTAACRLNQGKYVRANVGDQVSRRYQLRPDWRIDNRMPSSPCYVPQLPYPTAQLWVC